MQSTITKIIFLFFRHIKNLPKPQSFIRRSRANCRTIRTQTHMQNSIRMSMQLHNLFHIRIFPHTQLIFTKSMRTNQFLIKSIPKNSANLALSVHIFYKFSFIRAPKFHRHIMWTPSRYQQISLPRTPSQCFHRRLMLTQRMSCTAQIQIPNHQIIVISSRSQLRSIAAPFQSTNFLRVSSQFGNNISRTPHIVVYYSRVSAPWRENVVIPGKGRHSALVSGEIS